MLLDPTHIVIAGTIDADPTTVDDCLAAINPLQLATRNDEPGCLAYCFSADPCTPGRIVVYERWESAALLAAHFEHPNYHQTRAALGSFGLRATQVERLKATHAQPVYDADRVARVENWDD
jgi:quinol monooxygenase YgiN